MSTHSTKRRKIYIDRIIPFDVRVGDTVGGGDGAGLTDVDIFTHMDCSMRLRRLLKFHGKRGWVKNSNHAVTATTNTTASESIENIKAAGAICEGFMEGIWMPGEKSTVTFLQSWFDCEDKARSRRTSISNFPLFNHQFAVEQMPPLARQTVPAGVGTKVSVQESCGFRVCVLESISYRE